MLWMHRAEQHMWINLFYTEVNRAVYACITRWVLLLAVMQSATLCIVLMPPIVLSGIKLYTPFMINKVFYLSLKKKNWSINLLCIANNVLHVELRIKSTVRRKIFS